MTQDARFEDGVEAPLNIGAFDTADLQILSSLVQDAVFPLTEIKWLAGERRFALLLNRFRWEAAPGAQMRKRRSTIWNPGPQPSAGGPRPGRARARIGGSAWPVSRRRALLSDCPSWTARTPGPRPTPWR